jgi:hypothetical protein
MVDCCISGRLPVRILAKPHHERVIIQIVFVHLDPSSSEEAHQSVQSSNIGSDEREKERETVAEVRTMSPASATTSSAERVNWAAAVSGLGIKAKAPESWRLA